MNIQLSKSDEKILLEIKDKPKTINNSLYAGIFFMLFTIFVLIFEIYRGNLGESFYKVMMFLSFSIFYFISYQHKKIIYSLSTKN